MLSRLTTTFRMQGLRGTRYLIKRRLLTIFASRAKSFNNVKPLLTNKFGLEIGGPSQVFSSNGVFPIYPHIHILDNCDFATITSWSPAQNSNNELQYSKNAITGQYMIAEATKLDSIRSDHYDFILASHILEHVANPILALNEWNRVLKESGILVLVLPDQRFTFDHKRPITPMQHLIDDFDNGVTEADLTHFDEITRLHDLARDPEAGTWEQFQGRCLQNFKNRCLHHHVFDISLALKLIEYTGFKTIGAEELIPHHLLIIGQKVK